MRQVSYDCQQHERFHNQYRALFVCNTEVALICSLLFPPLFPDHLCRLRPTKCCGAEKRYSGPSSARTAAPK